MANIAESTRSPIRPCLKTSYFKSKANHPRERRRLWSGHPTTGPTAKSIWSCAFTRGERNAVVALIFLCFAALIAPKIYLWLRPVQHADNSRYKTKFESLGADSLDTYES